MSEYIINPQDLHDHLVSWNLDHIYHANTLATSCTFLKHRKLMSRGCVESMGLWQTSQKSDELDKKYGIWNDIFTDSCDVGDRAGHPNFYGPILFELDRSILLDKNLKSVKLTRFNPTKWPNIKEDERYIRSDNYIDQFKYGNFDHMITLQTNSGFVDLPHYLKTIVIDSPKLTKIEPDLDLFSYCRGAMRASIFDPQIFDVKVKRRDMTLTNKDYLAMSTEDIMRFFAIPGEPL